MHQAIRSYATEMVKCQPSLKDLRLCVQICQESAHYLCSIDDMNGALVLPKLSDDQLPISLIVVNFEEAHLLHIQYHPFAGVRDS